VTTRFLGGGVTWGPFPRTPVSATGPDRPRACGRFVPAHVLRGQTTCEVKGCGTSPYTPGRLPGSDQEWTSSQPVGSERPPRRRQLPKGGRLLATPQVGSGYPTAASTNVPDPRSRMAVGVVLWTKSNRAPVVRQSAAPPSPPVLVDPGAEAVNYARTPLRDKLHGARAPLRLVSNPGSGASRKPCGRGAFSFGSTHPKIRSD
jgi:hypothetical protein